MHFHLIKITRAFSLIISLSFFNLSLPPSLFLCRCPCHSPSGGWGWGGGTAGNVVSKNLDLIVSHIDAMFFFPWSIFSLPHSLLFQTSSGDRSVAWNVFALGEIGLLGLTSSAELYASTMQQCSAGLLSVTLCGKKLRAPLWLVKTGIFDIIHQRCGKKKNILTSTLNGGVGFTTATSTANKKSVGRVGSN